MAAMLTVNKRLPQGRGLAAVLLRRAATVPLNWGQRQQNCFDAEDSQGRKLAVALPAGTPLRTGDVLVADDGSLLRLVAQQQAVLELRPRADQGYPGDLLRAAYQLGRRALALEVHADHLRLAADPALAGLLQQLRLAVTAIDAPFEPEPAPEPALTAAAPARRTLPIAAAPAAHVHGPGCGHGH